MVLQLQALLSMARLQREKSKTARTVSPVLFFLYDTKTARRQQPSHFFRLRKIEIKKVCLLYTVLITDPNLCQNYF